jgi:hypothetical protein
MDKRRGRLEPGLEPGPELGLGPELRCKVPLGSCSESYGGDGPESGLDGCCMLLLQLPSVFFALWAVNPFRGNFGNSGVPCHVSF